VVAVALPARRRQTRTFAVGYVVRPGVLHAQHRSDGAAAGEEVAAVARVDGDDAVVVLVESHLGVLASRRTKALRRVRNMKTHGHRLYTAVHNDRTVQYNTIPYNSIQHNTTQYSTLWFINKTWQYICDHNSGKS